MFGFLRQKSTLADQDQESHRDHITQQISLKRFIGVGWAKDHLWVGIREMGKERDQERDREMKKYRDRQRAVVRAVGDWWWLGCWCWVPEGGWAGGGGRTQTWFLTTNTSDDFCVTWPHAPSMPLSTSLPGVLAFWGPFFPYCFLNGSKLNEERWCRV